MTDVQSPFDKYAAELGLLGAKYTGTYIHIPVGDRLMAMSADAISSFNRYKSFGPNRKLVERIVRLHERNGAKPEFVFSNYVHEYDIRGEKSVITHTTTSEVILFTVRGSVKSMFVTRTKELIMYEFREHVDRLFARTPDELDELIEPDPLVRMVARTAKDMSDP